MKVYYLQDTELVWNNIIAIATSPQKLIEYCTDGEVVLSTEEEVNDYLHKSMVISNKLIN